MVAIEGRPSAVLYQYSVDRVYCKGQSPALILVWAFTLHHSIINKELVAVFNYFAIAADAVHRWSDSEKAAKKTHRLQGEPGQKNCEKANEDPLKNMIDPFTSIRI